MNYFRSTIYGICRIGRPFWKLYKENKIKIDKVVEKNIILCKGTLSHLPRQIHISVASGFVYLMFKDSIHVLIKLPEYISETNIALVLP